MASTKTIDRTRLADRLREERGRFAETHRRSKALFDESQSVLLEGVPMNWMVRWPGPHPIFIEQASGAHLQDVDGNVYIDFCLGDTGAMAGHSPAPTVEAIRRQAGRGLTLMLPSQDAAWVGGELTRRFGVSGWQFCLTATDANRFAIRWAREITGRSKILVFNWCYHGSVDETLATLHGERLKPRVGNMGPPVDLNETTRMVEFNDLQALETALGHGDVACVLCEPALTNIGIVHPHEGFHDGLRELTRRSGTLLIIDETHTICTGPGGYTREHRLDPDILTIGKPIAGGIPAAAYGFSAETAERVLKVRNRDASDTGGTGGTLAGNPMSLAAMRATLGEVLTEAAFEGMISLAKTFTDDVAALIDEHGLGWHVSRLGCRAEYWFCEDAPRNGKEAAEAVDGELDEYMHLAALNRGVLMTPFHNMALMSPATTAEDVKRHREVFAESLRLLIGPATR